MEVAAAAASKVPVIHTEDHLLDVVAFLSEPIPVAAGDMEQPILTAAVVERLDSRLQPRSSDGQPLCTCAGSNVTILGGLSLSQRNVCRCVN